MSLSLCVYCASATDIDHAYFGVARQLGELIAQRGDTLVYGGGSVGLMGEVARAVKQSGGKVIGIIPEALVESEFAFAEADELIVTPDMRVRKAEMEKRCDAFVTLPGGFGTLEELFETLTCRLLKYHDKPIVIVNSGGFYDPLIELMDHMYEHRFARPRSRELYRVVSEVSAVYAAIAEQKG
ncbi:MAG: TIGR00730 family Rossman fold protein [Phycisphaeraceae bacterium]